MPRKHRKKIETKCDIIVGAYNQQSKQQAINNIQAMASTTVSMEEQWRRIIDANPEAEQLIRDMEERVRVAEQRARQAEQSPEKAMMLKKIQELRDEENANGKEIYYENQEATATEVVASIRLVDIVFQMVVAPCQSGKTGCMLATIDMLLQSDSNVNPDNIFVITGLSDVEWVSQTKKRLPFIGNNVIHRGQLRKSSTILKNIKNALIIIDECQIASKEDMSLDKLLEKTGLKDLTYLKDNNVNIVEFSATPNSTLNDIELWQTCSKMHIMKPGQGYKGHSTLIDNHRLYQAQDLFITNDPEAGLPYDYEDARNNDIKPATDAIKDVKNKIEMSYTRPRFHIIRTPTGTKAETVIGRFKTIFGDEYAYKKCYVGEEQLMDELTKIPEKHTFLFIKEKARCAVTFAKKNLIGILYERLPKTPKTDVIVQGLAGRACGYDVDDGIIVFSDVDNVKIYVKMVNSDFQDREDFTYTGQKSKKKTHLHPRGYNNARGEANVEQEAPTYTTESCVKVFNTHEEAKAYWKENLGTHIGSRGPNKPKKTDNRGFLTTSIRADTHVYSLNEVKANKNFGLSEKTNKYRYYPCYENTNDINTVKYVLIYL